MQALLANEFKGLQLQCSPADIVPRGPTYNDARYQTCAFAGSSPGSLLVDGEAYIRTSFGFEYAHIWRNFAIILLLAFLFLLVGVIATDYLHFAPSGVVRLFLATKDAKRRVRRARKATYIPPEDEERGSGRANADEEAPLLSAETSAATSMVSTIGPIKGHALDIQGATLSVRPLPSLCDDAYGYRIVA